jgi:hypothetical protein
VSAIDTKRPGTNDRYPELQSLDSLVKGHEMATAQSATVHFHYGRDAAAP